MSFDTICFDCDSTLSKIEGIDELATRVGLGAAMAKLTDAAMNGEVPLEAVYGQRLSLIRPDADSIQWLAERYIVEVVADAAEVFGQLAALGKRVHIISGGLRPAILPLARQLGVPDERVHAVDIYFHDDGSYRDYQQDSPLARNGGKAEVCTQLLTGPSALVMVGDGKTDMEAKQAGAFTIGFGGVVERAVVRELADVYIAGPSLAAILPYVL
ncbi:MAG: HAD-IB family phosphatase [Methylovulum miyakonense]|uniref:HAD-IB family phosphatase n=1 Tax=Methylovulum miyakonense TaxID=645578 RepID=UPI003BB63E09